MLENRFVSRVRQLFWFAGKDKDTKAQALKALKATKKGTWKKQRKERFSVVFHRPKTLKHQREPKYPRIRCGSRGIEVIV